MEEEHWHAMPGVAGSTPVVRSKILHGSLAQMEEERRASNAKVAGSSPAWPFIILASEAQNRVERQSSKLEEAGLTPVTRSTLINMRA